jgi:hypothetical protein
MVIFAQTYTYSNAMTYGDSCFIAKNRARFVYHALGKNVIELED